MSNDLNKIAISGRMVNQPKALTYNAQSYPKMCTFDMAVNKFSSAEPNHKKTEFYHFVAFGAMARRLCDMEKGTALLVDGFISVKDNKTATTTFHNMTIIVNDFTVSHWPANVSDLQITGRVTKDIKLRKSKLGHPIASVDIATKYFDFSTKNEATQFINIVAYRDMATNLAKIAKKGYRIQISGYLTTNVFKNEEKGVTYTNNSIVVTKFQVLDQGKETKKTA